MRKKLLLLLFLSTFSIGMMAADCYVGGIFYNLNTSTRTAEVTQMSHCYNLVNVNIPSTFTYSGNTYTVTSIGEGAFFCCSDLTSVTIPNSVTSIGAQAFDGCINLTSVTIPNSVTSIGDYAFDGCDGLTSISLPNSVTSIGKSAFEECKELTSITIPSSVTSIGEGAFKGCRELTSITVNAGNSVYDSRNNCNAIIEKSTNILISGCQNTRIPSTVKGIGNYAFFYCSGLTSITIPNSVTSIGENAFSYCLNLYSIDIPNSVTSIGELAFSECWHLTLVTIPSSVTSIGSYTFKDCTSLRSIVIPNSVTSIGDYAFYYCDGLTSVTVENPEPISISSSVFSNRANATLYVPYGSKSAYQAANYWKEFKTIIEVDNRPEQSLSYSGIPTKTYGDNAFTLPQNTTEGLTITWSSSNTNIASVNGNTLTIKGVGSANITATQSGNNSYKPFSKTYTLTVNKAPLTVTAKSYTITQGESLPTYQATYSGFKNNETTSVLTTQPTFSCSATTSSAPGAYTITPSGAAAANYSFTYVNGTLTIMGNQTVSLSSIPAQAYGATTYNLPEKTSAGLTITWASSNTNVATVSGHTLTIKNAGTATITATQAGNSNYNAFSKTYTLTVNKAPLTVTAKSYTITQGDALPTYEATYSGFKNNETASVLTTQPTFSCSATTSSAPGAYTITPSGAAAANYSFTYVNGTLTIMGNQTVSLSSIPAQAYGATTYNLPEKTSAGLTITWASSNTNVATVSGHTLTIKNAGTATITATQAGNSNYNAFSKTYTLTVNKAPLTVTAKSYTITQGNALPTFEATYSGFKNNETASVLTAQPTFSCSATSSSAPGTYDITPSGAAAANYSFTYVKGTLTIMGNQTVSLSSIPAQTYGATTYNLPEKTSAGLTITWASSNTNVATVSGHTLTIKNAGTATITATQAGNSSYNALSKTYTLTVNKAPLTVTAKSYTMKQGDALPTYDATYSGFKNGETKSVLTKQPTFSCNATSASAPGTYDINVSGAAAANYEISFVKGTLTITQADPVTVTANSYTIQYGDAIPTLEYTSEGAALSGTPALSCTATSTSPVGTYPITVAKGSVSNYNVTYVAGTLTITKTPLTVTANSYTIAQGEAMPTFEATYSGFKNGETVSVLTNQPSFSCEATPMSSPGTYDITPRGAEAQNYSITYTSGTLTITEPHNTLSASEITLRSDKDAPLGISLDNEDQLIAFEFYMTLPEGISIALDEDGYPIASVNENRSNRHTLEVEQGDDGTYHFLCYSSQNSTFKGNSGELLTVSLTCDDSVEPGTYQGLLSTIKFSDINENRIMLSDLNFNIEVEKVTMGDVNDDGDIDVMDVVAMVNYIMGHPSASFVFAAADIDGDNIVDVIDLVKEVRLVMDQAANAPSATYDQLSSSLTLKTAGDGSISLALNDYGHYVASQFVVSLSGGQRLMDVTTDRRHTAQFEKIAENEYLVVSYSNTNEAYTSNDAALTLHVEGMGSVTLENATFVNDNNQKVMFQNISSGYTDGIRYSTFDFSEPADIYTPSGILVRKNANSDSGLKEGVYIVNGTKYIKR